MHVKHLPWENISWDNFQSLSIYFAQNEIKNVKFKEYLKQGNDQAGIDLISLLQNDGKYIVIQCKRVSSIKPSELHEIINEFTRNEFIETASKFILITKADLQNLKLTTEIKKIEKELFSTYNILFENWDVNYLNDQLRHHYSLVANYFGTEEAERFCFKRFKLPTYLSNNEIKNYIPRLVKKFNPENETSFFHSVHEKQETFRFLDHFKNNRFIPTRFCLIGDAHQGKSLLLKKLAYDLENLDIPFVPLYIELKKYSVRPIQEILQVIYSTWKNQPASEIIVIVDGLDEVPTDSFAEVARLINEFSLEYDFINVIFSCRSIFFKHYFLSSVLVDFEFLELHPLQYYDVVTYLKTSLKTKYDQFEKQVKSGGMNNLLYHPFYLTCLIEEFKNPPNKLPNSKANLIEKFIRRSFKASAERRLRGGELHEHREQIAINVIRKFAFALQLSGLNSFNKLQIQEIFSSKEIELLQHSSLIASLGDNWSFTNAIFQEHIAALVLIEKTIAEVLNYISVGNTIRKIKTKWIQTVSSVLSLTDSSTEIHKTLIKFIQNDNIELLFLTDKSKFEPEFRLLMLKTLIEERFKNSIRPMLIYEDNIAVFINEDTEAVDYLLNILDGEMISERVKITVCRILRELNPTSSQKSFLQTNIKLLLQKTNNDYYAAKIVDIATAFGVGNSQLISDVIEINNLLKSHDYRNSVYELITSLGLADNYYQFGIQGINILIEHNNKISHTYSEVKLLNFLLSTKKSGHFKLLLKEMTNPEWVSYFQRKSMTKSSFMRDLVKTSVELHKNDPLIIFPIVEYVRFLGRKYLKDDFKEIDNFFNQTNTFWLASRILLNEIILGREFYLEGLIPEESYDYILFEYEESDCTIDFLWKFVWILRRKTKNEAADLFASLCNDASEGAFKNRIDNSSHDKYLLGEETKFRNDLIYIQSKKDFKNGIIKYFEAYGKKAIPEDEIFIDYTDRNIRSKTDSNFIFHYLIHKVKNNAKVYLKDCIKSIDEEVDFEYMQALEILEYQHLEKDTEGILTRIIENYYKSKVSETNFVNCIKQTGNNITVPRFESIIASIFQKFKFETPLNKLMEMVWYDMGGSRNFEHHNSNKEESLSQIILKTLPNESVEIFKIYILQNLKTKISSEGVLGNHIGLCKHLNILDAKEVILDLINARNSFNYYLQDAIDIYIHLGGTLKKLIPYFTEFEDYDNYIYEHLIILFKEEYPENTKRSLLRCLNTISCQKDTKVLAAKYLSELKEIAGLEYLVEILIKEKRAPYQSTNSIKIHNIETSEGLKLLKKVGWLLVDNINDEIRSFDSPRTIILEWLNGFASKSENDLNLVVNYLIKIETKLCNKYANSSDLLLYAERAIENFRDSDKTVKSLREIKSILKEIWH